METIENRRQAPFDRHHKKNRIFFALLCIFVGGMFIARDLGAIHQDDFNIVISWQMLLVAIGIFAFFRRSFIAGIILAGIGIYFLIPGLNGWAYSFWPAYLILVGVLILINPGRRRRRERCMQRHGAKKFEEVKDGFVTVDVKFGSAQQIVLEPVFRGAAIDVTFGSVVLDLRRTLLEAGETYIDLGCSFGGVELFIPAHWNLLIETDHTFAGCQDKRLFSQDTDSEHKLIIRGNISFGGMEIKS
ncbi:MAG: cell wall-active antibiotics response protein [Tannerellaceae bacterium]|jgi:predicted membrane protein|nr:cell wall-active antibiotics response protein [Tannerellaceae bacterium]